MALRQVPHSDIPTSLHAEARHAGQEIPSLQKVIRSSYRSLGFECLFSEACISTPNRDVTWIAKTPQLPASDVCYDFAMSDDVDGVVNYLFAITKDSNRSSQDRLTDVVHVLSALERRMNLSYRQKIRLLIAYLEAVALLIRVASFWYSGGTKLCILAGAETLATNGASLALSLKMPEDAIEILEGGRAVFWQQKLKLRATWEGLPFELGQEIAAVAHQLETSTLSKSPQSASDEDYRRRLCEQFELLANQARNIPGYERFLSPEIFSDLRHLAATNPIAILVGGAAGCGIIIIPNSTSSAIQIDLPAMPVNRVLALAQGFRASMAGARSTLSQEHRAMKVVKLINESTTSYKILSELWSDVMEPIFTALGWHRSKGRSRPRLTLCPTGAFAHLPFHAAGIYQGKSQQCCSDFCVISYIPSLNTLRLARSNVPSFSRIDGSALLVTAPKPFQKDIPHLPYVAEEATTVENALRGAGVTHTLTAHEGTIAEVIRALPSASIAHFACHGTQNPVNELHSGFFLSDGLLSLSDIITLRLPKALLAVLSACDTATCHCNQPDEVINLSAAMLFAGFRSVVGTMWSMGDIDGPRFANRFYKELFSGFDQLLDVQSIPYAVDAAVQELRQMGLPPSRWAPYIYLGI